MQRASLVLAFLVTGAAMQISQAKMKLPAAPPAGITWLRAVVIGRGGDKPLHAEVIYPSTPPAPPRPAVILVHGGGWKGGTYDMTKLVLDGFQLAKKGYFAASVEYRLSGEAPWPAQIQDCKLAVRWLRANAAKYNVDPNRIGCWGESAGGHLVACMGTMNDPALEGNGGYPGVSSKVQAVADLSGPTDFREGTFGNDDPVIDADHKAKDIELAEELFGTTFAKNPALWKQGSPILYIQPGDPPFYLFYGGKDPIVSLAQGTTFAAALQKAGVTVDLDVVPDAGHCGGTPPGQPPASKSIPQIDDEIYAFFDKYLKR
jgi:acetyl esterase/lipase